MSDQAPSVIDFGILDSYRALQEEDQPDVVTEFIDLFLSDLPQRLQDLASAVSAADPARVRSAAHGLKGSAGSIGASALAELCARIEALGRSGTMTGVSELASGVPQESARAVDALKTLRVSASN